MLYEFEPASPKDAAQECLALLSGCEICLTIVWKEYGHAIDGVSITRQEYRLARNKGLPVLAFIKGDAALQREPGTADFLKEISKGGLKYKRFGNLLELLREVRASLLKILKERFAIAPTSDENEIAEQTITATSNFELQALKRLRWEDLDHETARRLVASAEQKEARGISAEDLLHVLLARGLVWNDPETGGHYPTAAGIVLLARDPSVVFPHCRILADAYRGIEPDGDRPTTQIYVPRCRLPSSKRLPLSNATPDTPSASLGLIASDLTNIPLRLCAKPWSMLSLIGITRTAPAKSCWKFFPTELSFPVPACRRRQSHYKNCGPGNIVRVPATRFSLSASPSFIALRNVAVVSDECTTRWLTTGLNSHDSQQIPAISKSFLQGLGTI